MMRNTRTKRTAKKKKNMTGLMVNMQIAREFFMSILFLVSNANIVSYFREAVSIYFQVSLQSIGGSSENMTRGSLPC